MKGIIERLSADLRWRLGRAPKKHKPKRKERDSWGGYRIPGLAPFLLLGAYVTYSMMGAGAMLPYFQGWEWLHFLLFSWPGWIAAVVITGSVVKNVNNWFMLKAYTKHLEQSERFTLVEYYKYLDRQVVRAREDSALGGPAEVTRLRQLQQQLRELLHKGAGKDTLTVESTLSEEADFAEAVVEAYEEIKADPLQELDERLPGELRQRLEELDREVEGHRRTELE